MDPLAVHVIALVESWNSAGWGEYLLWETLEGKRDRPFKLLDKLPPTDLEVLTSLRDELKIWPFYGPVEGRWDTIGIALWRMHAAKTTAADIRDGFDGLVV